ncbi:phosphatase PAP2 family protein [Thiotrichales bacterium 19S3-7]|nr:phosphatase PAP2 family protein [Thiotrichales bacterium 19S3-7]MCF6801074.1 phosphatase PAP2 family protein [Thiotrichales bacterium 19S3-11]
MLSGLCFFKKHIAMLFAMISLLLLAMIQWRVQYQHFNWSFVLLNVWASVSIYLFAEVIRFFKPLKNKALSELIYYLLTFISFALLVRLFCYYSGTDLPLVPHPLIDSYLVKFDEFFHFNVADIATYVSTNLPKVNEFFNYIYYSLAASVIVTLLLMPLINWKSYQRMIFMFFFLISMTYVFCYFFPSVGPAYSYPNAHFSKIVIFIKDAYLQLRHDPSSAAVAASISCPSWHVLGCLLIVTAWWPIKRFGIRYFVTLYAVLLIISVFTTGWHYLADVVGSFIFMAIALFVARKLKLFVPNYDFRVLQLLAEIIKGHYKKKEKYRLINDTL